MNLMDIYYRKRDGSEEKVSYVVYGGRSPIQLIDAALPPDSIKDVYQISRIKFNNDCWKLFEKAFHTAPIDSGSLSTYRYFVGSPICEDRIDYKGIPCYLDENMDEEGGE